jgi:hypothetical protein
MRTTTLVALVLAIVTGSGCTRYLLAPAAIAQARGSTDVPALVPAERSRDRRPVLVELDAVKLDGPARDDVQRGHIDNLLLIGGLLLLSGGAAILGVGLDMLATTPRCTPGVNCVPDASCSSDMTCPGMDPAVIVTTVGGFLVLVALGMAIWGARRHPHERPRPAIAFDPAASLFRF